jgi:hypothetical protein
MDIKEAVENILDIEDEKPGELKIGLLNAPIRYRDGYSGQLEDDAHFQLPRELWPMSKITTRYLTLDTTGRLIIRGDYAWDYASVPFFHRFANLIQGKKSKVPSLVHDALCQMERAGLMMDVPDARLHIDDFFRYLLNERHFWRWRGLLWHKAVRYGARGKGDNKPILEAK